MVSLQVDLEDAGKKDEIFEMPVHSKRVMAIELDNETGILYSIGEDRNLCVTSIEYKKVLSCKLNFRLVLTTLRDQGVPIQADLHGCGLHSEDYVHHWQEGAGSYTGYVIDRNFYWLGNFL